MSIFLQVFFQFGADLDPGQAFPLFGPFHITVLLLLYPILRFALHRVRLLSDSKSDRVIQVAAVLVPVLEFSHTIWLYLCGQTQLVKLLPLHLCAMQSIFIPLAVFTKKQCFQDFVFATSLLGGIFAIVFPAGVANVYPAWHYQTIQTIALHALLIFIPLALIKSGKFTPSLRRFPRVLLIFLGTAMITAVVDFSFGENYMFLNAPPEGTPAVWIFQNFGHSIYLIVAFCVLSAVSFSIHIPFWIKEKKAQHKSVPKPSVSPADARSK